MWGEKKRKVNRKEEEGCFRYFSCFNIKGAWVWPNTSVYLFNTFFFLFLTFVIKFTTSSHDVPSNILKH